MAQAWVGDRARELFEKEEKAKELLEANGLGFLAHRVHLAYDPYWIAQEMVERKKRLQERLKPYLSRISSVAFQKADNKETFVYISRDLLPHDFIESNDAVIEMSYEDFSQKYKPIFVYFRKRGPQAYPVYSAPASKYYRFAKNYKVVLVRDHHVDPEVAATLTPNIYPLSIRDEEPVYVGYVLFIPGGDVNA